MFRAHFTLNLPGYPEVINLGEMTSHQDDPFRALYEAQEKRPVFVSALKATMTHPMFKVVSASMIQISITPWSEQLLLFPLSPFQRKRDERTPEQKIGYELFQNDLAATLTTPSKEAEV